MAASGHGTKNQEITTACLFILVGWVSERSERNPTSCYYMVGKHFHPLLWASALSPMFAEANVWILTRRGRLRRPYPLIIHCVLLDPAPGGPPAAEKTIVEITSKYYHISRRRDVPQGSVQ
jgi:hypothetical protein